MKYAWFVAATLITLGALASTASAEEYVVHVQGRGWGNWEDHVPAVANDGWVTKKFSFNGSAKLDGGETNTTVRNAIKNHCGSGNQCIVHCYSAGCLRTKKAIADLRASGNSLPGLMWVQASGSAAGGSELAEKSTEKFTGFMAKLLGQQEAIDKDLTVATARGTWSHIHDAVGVQMYHVIGNKDVCKKLLWFKICGSKYLPGKNDGVVAFHSAAGYSAAAAKTSGCAVSSSDENNTSKNVSGKYPYHRLDTSWGQTCAGKDLDHYGIVKFGTGTIEADIDGYATYPVKAWSDNVTGMNDCANASCDDAFVDQGADFSDEVTGESIAPDVDPVTSNTTGDTGSANSCVGHCGGRSAGGACWCDAQCATYGDCCSDYAAANCAAVNN